MKKHLIVGPKGFGGSGTKLIVTAKGFAEPEATGGGSLTNVYLGSNNLTSIYLGSNQISSIYVGSTKVWG